MKFFKSTAAFLILLFIVSSCLELSDPLSVDTKNILENSDSVLVHLKYSQEISISGDIKIKFDSVKSDSRCPMNVECVWAGNGEVKLMLTKGTESKYRSVNTLLDPQYVDFEGYRVFLKSLNPYPADAGKRIKQEEYSIDLLLKRLTDSAADPLQIKMVDNIGDLSIHKDYLSVENAEISGNYLVLKTRFPGGCKNHEIELYALKAIAKSNPPQVSVYISHNANGDLCEALITKEIKFSLENLRLYLAGNSGIKGVVLLNIFDPAGTTTKFSRLEYNY